MSYTDAPHAVLEEGEVGWVCNPEETLDKLRSEELMTQLLRLKGRMRGRRPLENRLAMQMWLPIAAVTECGRVYAKPRLGCQVDD